MLNTKICFLLFCILIFIAPVRADIDKSQCLSPDYLEYKYLAQSIGPFVSPMKIVAPLDVLDGNEYVCVLISFEFSDNGQPQNFKLLNYSGNVFLQRFAIQALRASTFPVELTSKKAVALFELERDSLLTDSCIN